MVFMTFGLTVIGKAKEITDGFIFLASNQSSLISVNTIEIDGTYLSK